MRKNPYFGWRSLLLGVLLSLGSAVQATPLCLPPPIDSCGKAPVHGTTNGVDWSAWWVEDAFQWGRVHWYRLPGVTIVRPGDTTWTMCAQEGGACAFTGTRQVRYGLLDKYKYATFTGGAACNNATFGDPAPGADKFCDYATVTAVPTTTIEYARALWALNIGARNCQSNPHPEAVPACNAMVLASEASKPKPILYNVAAATRSDGTRPGYALASGTLTADGTRHIALTTWCECWRGAVKAGTLQYCLVTKTSSYAACTRLP